MVGKRGAGYQCQVNSVSQEINFQLRENTARIHLSKMLKQKLRWRKTIYGRNLYIQGLPRL